MSSMNVYLRGIALILLDCVQCLAGNMVSKPTSLAMNWVDGTTLYTQYLYASHTPCYIYTK